jgi:hypothetical protein
VRCSTHFGHGKSAPARFIVNRYTVGHANM